MLDLWQPRCIRVLEQAVVSGYLFGSSVLGDFDPGWSDIDLCVLLRASPTQEQIASLRRLHADLYDRFAVQGVAGWRSEQLFDGVYGPAAGARSAGDVEFLAVSGGSLERGTGDPLPGFHRHALAEHGLLVFGEPAVITPASGDSLREGHAWLLRALQAPAESHSPVMQVGLMQECARAILFWSTGSYAGKVDSLRWCADAHPSLAAGCARALDLRAAGAVAVRKLAAETQTIYARFAPLAHERLVTLLAG